MRNFSSALLITASMMALLAGCQARQQTTAQPASPLQNFNAGAEIAQPPDMALRTVQHWLIQNFPQTPASAQHINPQTGDIQAQVQFDFPCMDARDCQQKQGYKVNASLRIKILPQRAALNVSHFYWQAGNTDPTGAISDPADKQQVQAKLQGLANSLFAELAIP